ncbi:DUF1311 domain-containing protein [Sphingomonas sp. ID1715]|uniref:lysozyme inhibitor LprI family protein n=1 Tax=Sphingomonas sp. ID1715 TaxID=1656898 RepID=UPI0014879C3C|nr:lysozyme inhibitor LprI family protein [Sphingomonas sp. ID1715]NNM75338.1 DUF1311 domain-containing protein [Sphingomonas sp. ID1715]
MILALLISMAMQTEVNCDDAVTQRDMNFCAGKDYAAADAALNRQWARTSTAMKAADRDFNRPDGGPGYHAALLAGQRAWLKYRDAHCVSEGYGARGGSMAPMLLNLCLAKLTKERTEQLRQLAVEE